MNLCYLLSVFLLILPIVVESRRSKHKEFGGLSDDREQKGEGPGYEYYLKVRHGPTDGVKSTSYRRDGSYSQDDAGNDDDEDLPARSRRQSASRQLRFGNAIKDEDIDFIIVDKNNRKHVVRKSRHDDGEAADDEPDDDMEVEIEPPKKPKRFRKAKAIKIGEDDSSSEFLDLFKQLKTLKKSLHGDE